MLQVIGKYLDTFNFTSEYNLDLLEDWLDNHTTL